MGRRLVTGLTRRRLRVALVVFVLALALPAAVLVRHAFGQLRLEAFHQQQALAAELSARIDAELAALVRTEEARSFADYAFLTVVGDPAANLLQRSPLAQFPPAGALPGLLGHFQVEPDGRLSSPLLPDAGGAALGLAEPERAARAARVEAIAGVLAENRLLRATATTGSAAPQTPLEAAFAPPDSYEERGGIASLMELGGVRGLEESSRAADREQAARKRAAPAGASDEHAESKVEQSALDDGRLAEADAGAYGDVPESAEPAPQAAFDLLRQAPPGTRLDMEGAQRLMAPAAQAPAAPRQAESTEPARLSRKEQVALPEALPAESAAAAGAAAPLRSLAITTFESELDPFEFSLLESGHFVLFRNVWRDGRRYIQGLLIEQADFLRETVAKPLAASTLNRSADLAVAWRGEPLARFEAAAARSPSGAMAGTPLHRARLSAPLSGLELRFDVHRLPAGPGAGVVAWTAATLALVLAVGCVLVYRAGSRQIDLARQQQDFVAAVSHELRTPLTSIRMYGEMLREGWVSDESRRRGYYDYIVDESERLSRLIGNVLQLARMTRSGLEPRLGAQHVTELAEALQARVAAQVERAGFRLCTEVEPALADVSVLVDEDFVSQVFINLVDNALKFAAGAERREVLVSWRDERGEAVRLSVRDYGPGVPRGQMKRIFRLFYRGGAELTRETAGTGIGLALVRELAGAMGAGVDVVDAGPGAEFRVRLQRA